MPAYANGQKTLWNGGPERESYSDPDASWGHRYAVDRKHQRTGIGRSLLQDVMLRCLDAAESIGGRVLLVHAKHDVAKAWYLQYGFEESPTDPLHSLMLQKDMRGFMQRRGVS
jgi:GNAT superfamily N-acetyltransferase